MCKHHVLHLHLLGWLAAITFAPLAFSTSARAADAPSLRQMQSMQGGAISQQSTATDVGQKSLLSSGASRVIKSGQEQVSQTQNVLEKANRNIHALQMGIFRSQNLATGFVPAPGVADFAAYFRATSAQKVDAKDVKSNVAAVADLHLGAITAEELARQAQAEELRAQTSESIKQILLTNPAKDQRVDLQMRLAEIQVERHAYLMELEIKRFNELHDKWLETKKGIEPVFKPAAANAALLQGIESLRTVVTQFPDHKRTAEALFSIGFLLTQIQSDSAALYFERLVKQFPKSSYVADAYLALGEYHFSKNRFDDSVKNYIKVLDHKGTSAYHYAVYKLGWAYYNIRGGEEDVKKYLAKSLAAFKLVVKLADTQPSNIVLKGLRKDALKDMVLVFADMGDIAAAQKYFETLNEPELYLTMLERLGWLNAEAGNYLVAISIYDRLVIEGALNARLPLFYSKIPDLYWKQGKRADLLNTLTAMSSALAAESPWGQKFKGDMKAMESRNTILAKQLAGWAEKLHMEAQKSKKEILYDEALVAYGLYLDSFGTRIESYAAHYFRGEILARRSKWSEAAVEYMQTATLDEKHGLKGKYTHDALVNAIGGIEKALASVPAPHLPEVGKAAEKVPLTALHDRLVKALDTFGRMFPTDPEALPMLHQAARVVYVFGDYSSANERWTTLAKRFPKSNEVYDGVRLVLKVPVERKEWPKAIAESRKFLAIRGVAETKLGANVVAVLKGALFSHGIVLESQEKRAEAAELFLAWHKEFSDDPDAPKALFNAANNKFRIGKLDDAISALRTILAQYPKSELVPNAHYMIASSFDALGQFGESAASYEQLVKDAPRNSFAPDALLRAAEQRIAAGESEQAIKDGSDFLQLYPKHQRSWEGYLFVGRGYLKSNNFAAAAKTFASGAEMVGKTKSANAVYLYGLAADSFVKGNDPQMTARMFTIGSALFTQIPEKDRDAVAMDGARLLGQAEISRLERFLAPVYAKKITDGLQLTAQFTKIKDEVSGLVQKYVTIAKLGNAEAGVAALYQVAVLQEFLSKTLLSAPVPVGAKPEEVEQFKGILEKAGLPLQEEATNLYLTAWNKASETEAMTPYTRKLYEKLVVLRPSEFRTIVEDMPASAYYSSDIVLTQETKAVAKN